MTDYKHLRELAESAIEDWDNEEDAITPALIAFGDAASPQTMIALIDELERQRGINRRAERQTQASERRVDALQARIDAALTYIDDPGNWGTYDGRRRLLHDLLSTPTENGEEQ